MRNHDQEFGEFFAATWSRLYRTTFAVAGDRPSTEAALQQAFADTYARWSRFSPFDDPETYVCGRSITLALKSLRKTSPRWELPIDDREPMLPVSGLEEDSIDDEMWAAVLMLSPPQRAVMVLQYREDLTQAEIAVLLGWRVRTVQSLTAEALAALRGLDVPSVSQAI